MRILKDIFEKVKKKDYKKNNLLLKVIVILSIFIKSTLFMALIDSTDIKSFTFREIVWIFLIIYLVYSIMITSFGYLFKGKSQGYYYIVLDFLFSIFLIFNTWYFRANLDFISIKNIFFTGTFNPMGLSLFQFKVIDLIFILDLPIILAIVKLKKLDLKGQRNIRKFKNILLGACITIGVCAIFTDIRGDFGWNKKMFFPQWTPLMMTRAGGPIGYQVYEVGKTLNAVSKGNQGLKDDEVQAWLKNNVENVEDNEYKGIFKGKNVIFLQLESLEEFVIGKKVDGQEISPFLNKLAKEGLYFDNIYEQNNAGNSIDCDVLANASIIPTGRGIATLFNGQFVYENSMQRVLKGEGYETVSTRGENPGEFYWTELHKNGLGVDKIWDLRTYNYDEAVGYGLSDRSFFTQLSEKLKTLKKPFYLHAATLSNHGPFTINDKYKSLKLPEDIDESYLGGYFQSVRYMDEQLEMFFGKLKSEGLLDNTVFVLYGDHGGVHKYYNDEIEHLDYEGNWWKEYTKKIPLIIYSPGVKPHTFGAHGGQIDIMPTVLYMMGVNKDKFISTSMGRILVNTNRDATIIKGNEIKGNLKSQNEKEHLEKAYSIGEKAINGK